MRNFLFATFLAWFTISWTQENDCHVFMVQVETLSEEASSLRNLTEDEQRQIEILANQFTHLEFSAVYSSDRSLAVQTAQLLATTLNCPLVINPTLRDFSLGSLFKTVGGLKALAERIYQNHLGQNVIFVTHESLINFAGRYATWGFQGIPHFSHVQLEFNGTSIRLP